MPHGRVCFVRGESPVSIFAKLFGKSRQDGGSAARHRASRNAEMTGGAPGDGGERPLFRDEVAPRNGDTSSGHGAVSVDPGTQGRIGSGAPPTSNTGGGSALPVCNRCGTQAAEASRFCSNCGAPLRGGVPAEGSSETTSTISISGLEAYEAEVTGQHASPVLPPEAQAAVDALPVGSALLIVRRGPNSGSRFLLDGELTTAGRHPESDIFLDDVTVSRRHVEFRRGSDGVFTVSDVGSLNGTYVNRERIESGVPLGNGDEVQIGKYRLVFFASQRTF
ncbi:zinc-ribbon and FHA domain-containing protein [Streptomyces sp. NBC_01775]|uniref:FHA domain-containing protein n=1 Tax=Streptomyces sp. NBC_01775 TaxID=2975939 RepID=UPI002DD9960A|nr:FHA domain-containing protein [Streptomyces sp. NBC_01775]WSB81919.1 zinc-ribbon and FHA domain-containing protein [Streptomyces sp. NBC_01775]